MCGRCCKSGVGRHLLEVMRTFTKKLKNAHRIGLKEMKWFRTKVGLPKGYDVAMAV